MSAPHILVVDDEPDIRTLVQEILEDEGYRSPPPRTARPPAHALRDRRPDLILLDIWMPDSTASACSRSGPRTRACPAR
jgi:two-component system, NtrC family, nitrogen regulation response regulator NtrX